MAINQRESHLNVLLPLIDESHHTQRAAAVSLK